MPKKRAKGIIPPLPGSLVISGHDFEVELAHMEDRYGDCDVTKRKIRIDPTEPLDRQWETLFHETIHAVLGLSGYSELLKDDLEEALVVLLQHQLWPLLDFR